MIYRGGTIKRSVIQVANSTQLISLPRKWSQQYNIKKGDELEVEEQGNKLVVSTEKDLHLQNISIDVTGLDRTSILYHILTLYKRGYDEITVSFKEPYTTHFRTSERKTVSSVLHDVVSRLTGFEIIQQKETFCVIREITEPTTREFESALRRVFILINDACADIIVGIKNNDHYLLQTIEEKHNTIMKFVSFCLRILSKKGHPEQKKTILYYHIISNIDKIVDILKYSTRDYISLNLRLSKESVSIAEDIFRSIALYSEFFYKFQISKVSTMYENRDKVLRNIRKHGKKSPSGEILFLAQLSSILELVTDITESRIGAEY